MTRLRVFVPIVLGLILAVEPAAAQEQQYELSNFDVTIHVRADGSYLVEESLTYDFQQGSFSYAYRSIVEDGAGAVRDLRVTSPDATVDSVRIEDDEDTEQIWWTFPERPEPARFDLHYVLDEAIYERGGRNEVHADVMADGAVVTTRDVDVRITLPTEFDLTPAEAALEPSDGTVGREAGRLVAGLHRDLVEEGDELSVELSFPKQIPGEYLPTAGDIVGAIVLMLLAIGGGALLRRRWRGPRPQVTSYRPPEDVDLPSAAVLMKISSQQAFPAVLFDLVLRGHLTLRHVPEEASSDSDEAVHVDVHPDRSELSDFERALVDELSTYETMDEFWSDTKQFRKEATRSVRDELVREGWLEQHTRRSNILIAAAIFAVLAGFAGLIVAKSAVTFFAFVGSFGVCIGSFVAATRRHPWTEAGARRGMALRSFLEYEKEEVDVLRESDPTRAAERLLDSLPWLMLNDDVSADWVEEIQELLEDADRVPNVPDGFQRLMGGEEEATAAATAAFVPVVAVMSGMESSGAGAAGAAGGAGAAGAGGAGAAGAG